MAFKYYIVFLAATIVAKAYLASSCPSIVSRSTWGARSASLSNLRVNPPPMVFIHHTTGSGCTSQATCSSKVRGIQNYHMDTKRWGDIGYSFLIGGDGRVYQGRGWGKTGAHTLGFNDKSIGIAFIGDFSTVSPSSAMLNAAKDLIACGVRQGKIASGYSLYGHRQAKDTACPGNRLYSLIKSWSRWSPEYLYRTSRCSALRGTCQETSAHCRGRFSRGLCPGPSNVQCCSP